MHEEKYIKLSVNDLSTIIRQQFINSGQSLNANHATAIHANTTHATARMTDSQLWQTMITFITVMIVIWSTKPSYLFTNSYNPTFKPIMIGNGAGKITLCHFIIIVAILCCCVVY